MECSSSRAWDGLAESSWTCFPHYAFSRLNGSVSFILGFCDAVLAGFTFPFSSPFWSPRVFPGVLYSAQQCTCPKGHLAISPSHSPALPSPLSGDPEFTWGSEMFLCTIHTWGGSSAASIQGDPALHRELLCSPHGLLPSVGSCALCAQRGTSSVNPARTWYHSKFHLSVKSDWNWPSGSKVIKGERTDRMIAEEIRLKILTSWDSNYVFS